MDLFTEPSTSNAHETPPNEVIVTHLTEASSSQWFSLIIHYNSREGHPWFLTWKCNVCEQPCKGHQRNFWEILYALNFLEEKMDTVEIIHGTIIDPSVFQHISYISVLGIFRNKLKTLRLYLKGTDNLEMIIAFFNWCDSEKLRLLFINQTMESGFYEALTESNDKNLMCLISRKAGLSKIRMKVERQPGKVLRRQYFWRLAIAEWDILKCHNISSDFLTYSIFGNYGNESAEIPTVGQVKIEDYDLNVMVTVKILPRGLDIEAKKIAMAETVEIGSDQKSKCLKRYLSQISEVWKAWKNNEVFSSKDSHQVRRGEPEMSSRPARLVAHGCAPSLLRLQFLKLIHDDECPDRPWRLRSQPMLPPNSPWQKELSETVEQALDKILAKKESVEFVHNTYFCDWTSHGNVEQFDMRRFERMIKTRELQLPPKLSLQVAILKMCDWDYLRVLVLEGGDEAALFVALAGKIQEDLTFFVRKNPCASYVLIKKLNASKIDFMKRSLWHFLNQRCSHFRSSVTMTEDLKVRIFGEPGEEDLSVGIPVHGKLQLDGVEIKVGVSPLPKGLYIEARKISPDEVFVVGTDSKSRKLQRFLTNIMPKWEAIFDINRSEDVRRDPMLQDVERIKKAIVSHLDYKSRRTLRLCSSGAKLIVSHCFDLCFLQLYCMFPYVLPWVSKWKYNEEGKIYKTRYKTFEEAYRNLHKVSKYCGKIDNVSIDLRNVIERAPYRFGDIFLRAKRLFLDTSDDLEMVKHYLKVCDFEVLSEVVTNKTVSDQILPFLRNGYLTNALYYTYDRLDEPKNIIRIFQNRKLTASELREKLRIVGEKDELVDCCFSHFSGSELKSTLFRGQNEESLNEQICAILDYKEHFRSCLVTVDFTSKYVEVQLTVILSRRAVYVPSNENNIKLQEFLDTVFTATDCIND